MKNLFILNEEERKRILGLHEGATKRQYLGEQIARSMDDPNIGVGGGGDNKIENLQDPWKNYPCVTSASSKKEYTLKDGSKSYEINGIVYFNNGRAKHPNGAIFNYECKGGVPTEKQPTNQPATKTKKTTQTQQINIPKNNWVYQFQQALGFTGKDLDGKFGPHTLEIAKQKLGITPTTPPSGESAKVETPAQGTGTNGVSNIYGGGASSSTPVVNQNTSGENLSLQQAR